MVSLVLIFFKQGSRPLYSIMQEPYLNAYCRISLESIKHNFIPQWRKLLIRLSRKRHSSKLNLGPYLISQNFWQNNKFDVRTYFVDVLIQTD